MADTTLALADVVAQLNATGWTLTGGAEKTRIGSPAEESLDVVAAEGNGSNLLVSYRQPEGVDIRHDTGNPWLTCHSPDGTVARLIGHPCWYAHPSGDESVIKVYGMKPIMQRKPAHEGGGAYTVDRQVTLMSFYNEGIRRNKHSRRHTKDNQDHVKAVQALNDMFTERPIVSIAPKGGDSDRSLLVTYAGGGTSQAWLSPNSGGGSDIRIRITHQ